MYDWGPGYKFGTGLYNSFSEGSNQFSFWEGVDAFSVIGSIGAKGWQIGDNFISSIGVSSWDMGAQQSTRAILRETQLCAGKTPVPNGVSAARLKELMGWGEKEAASWAKVSVGYTNAEIQALKNAGFTRSMIEGWQNVYRQAGKNAVIKGNPTTTPFAREKLMQQIIDKW